MGRASGGGEPQRPQRLRGGDRPSRLLDRADALQATGFDVDALTRLGHALVGAAEAEGRPTPAIVAAFLDAAADRRQLAQLRAQVAAAQQRVEEAEEQARGRIAEAKRR